MRFRLLLLAAWGRAALVAAVLLAGTTCFTETRAQPVGFSPAAAQAQEQCEARLQTLPGAQAFRRHLQRLTREPHPAGSAANERVRAYIAGVMAEAGLAVETFPYDLYMPGPHPEGHAALVTPVRQPLNGQEYVLEADRFSGDPALTAGWNAFSGSGDVTAEVVYANYGRKEDFEWLRANGISVAGKIVLARYGGNFRGFKAKFAEAHGAAGLIMYSDPADGGYADGLPYPEGRYLSESTVQRGSVITTGYWGDPLTPFEPALPAGAEREVDRLDPSAVGLHTIPVLPLPHGAAQEILERMAGAAVPPGWQGALPFAYRLAGGPGLTVRLRVDQPKQRRRAANVVGTVEGSAFPDEWIILGAHYDAWTFGAVDPNSGTAMLLTLAEALGQLVEEGCRPRRSVKIAHWDAEEYGIMGSVEWVEQLRDVLSQGAVAYLNADAAVSGDRFSGAAAPSLKGPVRHGLRSAQGEESVFSRWQARGDSVALGNLGGGSDHVGFYAHLGVPSAGLSMSSPAPIYHSAYDNLAWYERFADTTFAHGPALARIDGVLALRLANADVLPYDVSRYATDVAAHLAFIEQRIAAASLDARLEPLHAAVAELATAAEAFEAARRGFVGGDALEADALRPINRALIGLEKAFLHPEGLQERPWNRSLYASPDPFSGYASWMLPGLRYGVETGDAAEVEAWRPIYVAAVRDLTRRVRAVTERLR